MKARDSLSEKLSSVPNLPGVYILKGSKERVLYVGKAKNLRARLGSYFQKSAALDMRKSAMVRTVKDFSFIATDNELEALILEANFIKQYKPKFNIILRDDKNYPYLKVTVNEEWPGIEVVRRIKKDGSIYFGPYVPSGSMWEALSFIRKQFNIRPCKYRLDKPMRPCIQHQMKRCPAPCAGFISREDYMKAVNEAVLFLRGQKRELLDELESRMQALSDGMRFEDAAAVRDRVSALKRAWESQKVISPELGDMDVIGHYMEAGDRAADAVFQVFFIRNGIMIGARDFYLRGVSATPVRELYHGFIEMFYAKGLIPPGEIITPVKPEAQGALLMWLKQNRGGRVRIVVPKEGKRLELLRMASENARLALLGKRGEGEVLGELKERLSLPSVPRTIGAFDISTISGSESVGAFICWEDGEFKKDMYRHLKIKTVSGMDDYAMMAEAVRRISGGLELPDLVVIDGGRGQLEAAAGALPGRKCALIAVAKKPDRAFTLTSDEPVDLEDRRPSSLLLKKIRDEVHRFAISFHRKLRSKRLMESRLQDIKGIGKKRRLALLKRFGSIEAIKNAATDELASLPGMNLKAAVAVKEALYENRHDMV
ncbi:MAG: excinuclease ABC subunit UvrC [Thermodesulfovibrionales bacterium]|nr:excinuclease ABC subunit UvrC [Thermodesulfovibrionales bacterium]